MGFLDNTNQVTEGALASAADLAQRLGTDAADPDLLLALRRASDRFRGEVGYPVNLVEDDTIHLSGDGTETLLLPGRPVIGNPTITVWGDPVQGVEIGRRAGILYRYGGWPRGLDNIEVTYTHGWAVIPTDIQDAVLDVAELAAVIQPGIESVDTGNERVKFLNRMIDNGTTRTWARVLAKYQGTGQNT